MITNDQSEFVNNLMWADSLEEHELARPIDNSDDDSDDDTYISHEQDYTLPSHDTETAGDGLEIAKNEAEDFAQFVGLIVDSGPFGATNYETNREIVIQMLVNGSTTEDEAKSDLGGYIDSFLRRSTAEAA
ncbi:predicted protein [Pyrenophora tritici-repentis Pt-1C-BFP]|uniref:Uncharacterized protein n=1 Tax=Pyrenophora tritici-repentis (strain Pt-1C-BFP) TaxID=426418 RepID=B2WFS6_PYRTR|nr:uncharacterized protein PTRG_08782 [Pyrenophora tritici-repentis Pt-1C-BFP]EDU41833.1 predicted protein [Pyrenophora tritici-repentis Pt-1C-BFP]